MKIKEIKINKDSLIKILKIDFAKSVWDYLFKKSGTIAMIVFLIVSFFSGFIIYKYLYLSVWNEEQKMNYLHGAEKEKANFKISDFDKVIKKIEERKIRYKEVMPTDVEDIFRL